MDREAVDKITADQHSLITAAQFVDITGSESMLRWAVNDGWLERYRGWHGLYVVRGAPETPYQPHMGAALLGGSACGVSGFPGAFLWDVPDILDAPPEITVFGPTRRIKHVTVHRSQLAAHGNVVMRHGIPTVRAALIVVQLAQMGAGYLAERAANNFFPRHVASPREILDLLDAVGRRRTGTKRLRTFCNRALEVRGHDDSPAARDLGSELLALGVPPFVTQHELIVDGRIRHLDLRGRSAWSASSISVGPTTASPVLPSTTTLSVATA